MGNYAEFWIGPFYLGKTKSEADPRLVHLFRESDRNEVVGTKKELPFTERLWFDYVKDGENVIVFYYHAPVPIVRDRLNLKGYTLETAKSAVSLCLEWSARLYPAWREHFQELALATGDDWFKGLQWIRENSHPRDSAQIEAENHQGCRGWTRCASPSVPRPCWRGFSANSRHGLLDAEGCSGRRTRRSRDRCSAVREEGRELWAWRGH